MSIRIDATHSKCSVCKQLFVGVSAQVLAEKCEQTHEKVFISVYDFELSNFLTYFKTHKQNLLPRGFVRKLQRLESRALRGGTH